MSLIHLQINLGVCQENPSTTAGTIRILENLQQYVPNKDGNLLKLVVFGDGFSCERHNDAHMARSNRATDFDKLQGLEPQVQEFHKRMLLMQVNKNLYVTLELLLSCCAHLEAKSNLYVENFQFQTY